MPHIRKRVVGVLAASVLALMLGCLPVATSHATPAAQAGTSIALQPVLSGLRQPLYVTHAGDGSGRIFVVEKGGVIRVRQPGDSNTSAFLDLTPLVGSQGSEQGLLGLAFHPRYAENGYFYVNYTNREGNTVVARYQVSSDPNVADPGTGKVILTQQQPFANHNGGDLVFGPDGYLWISLGDGGSGGDPNGNGQNPGTWLGKLLRIDVDNGDPYAVPADNPYVEAPDARPEVWAIGLRNPWRFSFDRLTNDLYIGEVGQNQWEEVDFVPAGAGGGLNFGWNRMEGNHCYLQTCDPTGLQLPVAEYSHDEGCSITGGYVYRGAAFPSLTGTYFFGDYCSGRVWSLTHDESMTWHMAQQLKSSVAISSFGQDEDGELYVTGLADGRVYQLVVAGQ